MTLNDVRAMCDCTLDDVQEDPLYAAQRIRDLAREYINLREIYVREQDRMKRAVGDLTDVMFGSKEPCDVCERNGEGCSYRGGLCRPIWRGWR